MVFVLVGAVVSVFLFLFVRCRFVCPAAACPSNTCSPTHGASSGSAVLAGTDKTVKIWELDVAKGVLECIHVNDGLNAGE